jgi:hypothetical protein
VGGNFVLAKGTGEEARALSILFISMMYAPGSFVPLNFIAWHSFL